MTRFGSWLLLVATFTLSTADANELTLSHPTAIVVREDNPATAFIANRNSGVVSRLDLQNGTVTQEFAVGKGLTDLAAWPNTNLLLAVDNQAPGLFVLEVSDNAVNVVSTLPLPAAPLRIAVSDDGSCACLTFEWSPSVHLVELMVDAGIPSLNLSPPIATGFSQQELVPIADGMFLVADRFRGQLAVVDIAGQRISRTHQLSGHNIRGMTVEPDGKSVLIAHQILSRVARTTLEDIHWGMVMQNLVRRIPIADILNNESGINKAGRLYRVGDTGNGFADPAAILVTDDGFMVVSAGTNQLMLMGWNGKVISLAQTGARPIAVARVDDRTVAVVNSLSHTVSVIELADDDQWKARRMSEPPTSTDRAAAGEIAFHNAELSHDGWMSCHSCHTDGHSPDLLADTSGDDSFGNPKRIPSLFNVSKTGPWGWTGNKSKLADQLSQTLRLTMHSEQPLDETIEDLSAFLTTLSAPTTVGGDADIARGSELFESHGCIRCHDAPHWTTPKTYDVGLKDESGRSQFNPPSLQAVQLRSRFFHDGRATSLESVLSEHRHQIAQTLSDEDEAALVRFLKTL